MDGDRCTNGCYLFSIAVVIGKRLEYANYGTYQKRCETVYVKEVDRLKKPRGTALEVIRRSGG